MRSRHLLAVVGLLVASCTDDCSCGEGEGGDADERGGQPRASDASVPIVPLPGQGAERPARDPDFKPIDAGAAAGTLLDREAGHFARLKSPELARFELLQKQLVDNPVQAKTLAKGARLEAAFPNVAGDLKAAGPVQEGPTSAGRSPIVARSRSYSAGTTAAIVKVTDTGQAPQLREDFVRRLTLQGDPSVGRLAPAVLGDEVVLEAFFARGSSSWATALVGGRYLIEVRVRGAADQRAASRIFADLKLSGLAK